MERIDLESRYVVVELAYSESCTVLHVWCDRPSELSLLRARRLQLADGGSESSKSFDNPGIRSAGPAAGVSGRSRVETSCSVYVRYGSASGVG